jgi:hypothetical protein
LLTGGAATECTIGWEPQPGPQTALLACPVFEVFFGGARGGGKTDGMLGDWASHADLHGKTAVGLMVRRERVQLLETIERSRQIFGPIGARYNDQDPRYRVLEVEEFSTTLTMRHSLSKNLIPLQSDILEL